MITSLTSDTFDSEIAASGLPTLVVFRAEWSKPCRYLEPVMQQIAHDYQGKLQVGKVDTDESPELAERFIVESVPTLILFINGEEAQRIVGAVTKEKIEEMILNLLGEG